MNISSYLLEKTSKIEAEISKTDLLLTYPEITADTSLYRSLLAKRQSFTPLYNSISALKKVIEEIENLKSIKDESLAGYIEEEKILLQNKEEELCYDIIRLSLHKGKSKVKLEFLEESKPTFPFFLAKLRDCYRESLTKEGFSVQLSPEGLVIEGENALELLSFESGIQVGYNKNNLAIRTTVYPIFTPIEKIEEKEIEISLFHSGGAGGQNINKVETAVRATHLPTGIVVTCQDERSQLRNKERAITNLTERVKDYYNKEYEKQLAEAKKAANNIDRIRIWDFKAEQVTDKRLDNISYPISHIEKGNLLSFAKLLFIEKEYQNISFNI